MSLADDAGIQLLHSDLEALRTALDSEELALAGQIMVSHDRHLREYIERVGSRVAVDGLRGLLSLQQNLMAEMLQRRDLAAARMRAQRHTRTAVSAYQHAQGL
jgi:hypothetical protein